MVDSEIEKIDLNASLINISMAFTAGYIAKRMLLGSNKDLTCKIAGVLAEVLVANVVFNHAESIKKQSTQLYHRLLKQNGIDEMED